MSGESETIAMSTKRKVVMAALLASAFLVAGGAVYW